MRSACWRSSRSSSRAACRQDRRRQRQEVRRPVRRHPRFPDVTVRGAAFLGIGAMVGAGIFALLGEAGAVAGSAVWLSFLLAGIVATLLGYNVVKLGVRYPSSGGLIAYLRARVREWPPGRDRVLARLLRRDRDRLLDGRRRPSGAMRPRSSSATTRRVGWDNVFTSIIVVAMAAVSLVGARRRRPGAVADRGRPAGRLRGLHRRDDRRHRLRSARVRAAIRRSADIVASVALTFFAYLGFSVITFAVGDLRDPARELPKAMYLALGVTTADVRPDLAGRLRHADRRRGRSATARRRSRRRHGRRSVTRASRSWRSPRCWRPSSSVNATLYASGGLTDDARRGRASSRRSSGAARGSARTAGC